MKREDTGDWGDNDPENITGKYILVDKVPVACPNLRKWAEFMEAGNRHVAKDYVGKLFYISTVFLGLDHCFIMGKHTPVLFETMIFGNGMLPDGRDNYQTRCCTWAEAEAMHKEAVDYAQSQAGMGRQLINAFIEVGKDAVESVLYKWWPIKARVRNLMKVLVATLKGWLDAARHK